MSFVNHIQQVFNRGQTNIGYARLGIISSPGPNDSTVKVVIQPEGMETGFIPYSTPWIGWYAPPVPGQQCLVLFQEGDKSVPIGAFLLYGYGGVNPPAGMAPGEAIMHHSSGSFVKMHNSGKVTVNSVDDVDVVSAKNINATATTQINLTAPIINFNGNTKTTGNAEIDGTLIADDGSITASGGDFATTGSVTAQGNVTGNGISLDSHVHGGVTTGGSNTGGPS